MSRPLDILEASCAGLVRRMVRLPQTISRAVDQGLDLMRDVGGPRNHHQFPPPNVPVHNTFQPEWGFLASFEQQYGLVHPFFYACRFVEVLKMAQDEQKLVFLYLHSPNHPFTPPFCKNTLCSEVVVQFLDANFVSWGGAADRDEGLHMATMLRPASFPFCAVVVPHSGDSLAVVQQMEGPMTPEELLEILQTTLEEQGPSLGNKRAKEIEKRRTDIRLRQEQDAAYSTSLLADQEEESQLVRKKKHQDNANAKAQNAQILIRFPNGERMEKTFLERDKIGDIFKFVDSLGTSGVGSNYKLVSSFPRKVYGVDQMEMTLKDAGFYPKITLFIELE
ncbi:plant UBX domain-containing protein 10-like isoform X2 [Rutidosis leptorrhynchoides]|uniref:plant UBX domain-containing protein 10-like isoform X2 n=1 Tax=Rutidosis leptorrhynchoides TaxID=125765 RepID=UPI003A99F59C